MKKESFNKIVTKAFANYINTYKVGRDSIAECENCKNIAKCNLLTRPLGDGETAYKFICHDCYSDLTKVDDINSKPVRTIKSYKIQK